MNNPSEPLKQWSLTHNKDWDWISKQETTREEICVFSIIVHEEYIFHRTVSLLRNYCRFCFIGGSLKLVIYLTFKRVWIILCWDLIVVWWHTFSYLVMVSKINSTEWVQNFNLPMYHPYFNGLVKSKSRTWDIDFNGKDIKRDLQNILNVHFSSLFRFVFSLELIVTMAFCTIPTDFLYQLWFSS